MIVMNVCATTQKKNGKLRLWYYCVNEYNILQHSSRRKSVIFHY